MTTGQRIAAALGLAGLVAWWAQRRAAQTGNDGGAWPAVADLFGSSDGGAAAVDASATVEPPPALVQSNLSSDQGDANVRAFLAMIAKAEGTDRRSDPYRVCYGYRHTIRNLADHPAITGEWKGEPLDNLGPAYKGKVSTAAGRYQMIRATWQRAKAATNLPDFGPDSQDIAAMWLIAQRGAMDDVRAGRIAAAVAKCRTEWASLPDAGAGQPERSLQFVTNAYTDAGGTLA